MKTKFKESDIHKYNPYAYLDKYYNEYEKNRKKAGFKKPDNQIKDEERYKGTVEEQIKSFWEYNKKWKENLKKGAEKRKSIKVDKEKKKAYDKKRYAEKKR